MDPTRQRRREEINKDLTFIQSSLAYPDPEGYQDFLTQLVWNLLEEGNALFRDKDWEQAVKMFTEGLNVSDYAEAEEIHIPQGLLESLFVNRATAFHSMGDYERGVADCDSALQVCEESHRAVYRKALCLKELGKLREAYNCTTHPLLVSRPDLKVSELARELAAKLGLKVRKPYVSSKVSAAHVRNGSNPLLSLAPVRFPSMPQTSFPVISSLPESAACVGPGVVDPLEESELIGDDLDSLLDGVPHESTESPSLAESPPPPRTPRTPSCSRPGPAVLPAPSPQLPPAFFNPPVAQLGSLDPFSSCSISTSALDSLDDLSASGGAAGPALPNVVPLPAGLDALDALESLDDILDRGQSSAAGLESNGDQNLDELDKLDSLQILSNPLNLDVPKGDLRAMEPLDSLDLFPSVDGVVSVGGAGLDWLSDFCSAETSGSGSAAAPLTQSPNRTPKARKKNQAGDEVCNPLSSTHDFLLACSSCFPRTGKGIYSFVHKPELVHSCDGDILLCRRKAEPPQMWTRVRPLPTGPAFSGPFVLCRELLKSGDEGVCKYGEKCNFAFNQLEIDVWMLEREGALVRKLLFESTADSLDPVSRVTQLLQEDKGVFMFLCQECFDNKPRIISKRSGDNHTVCSNMDVQHSFDANKCLVFMVKTHNVTYKKVRPLRLLCRLDLCRQAIRSVCLREDECLFAHSVIELKTWRAQQDTGISPEEIVKVSTQFKEKLEQNFSRQRARRLSPGNEGSKPRGGGGGGGARKTLNMRMKFVCAQCWQGCNVSEPDKSLKHCTAKARHPWAKERSVLLVKSAERSKWVPVRQLPHDKNYPRSYEICLRILNKGKCNYSGQCPFAHSQEEKEMWMYMKNNNMPYMQQIYDMWLSLTAQNLQTDEAVLSQSTPEEKNIVMPTDYAEPEDGFHCRLCGKHCNSERQWQQHVSTEKHKDRVFSCEGEEEALTWSYRFPGTRFELCSKLDGGCPDGVSCDSAHSPEELQEWTERRDFLRQKLAKARDDMLVMPDEFDFGKYNFLLQD
ncbi:zinc finger CCCH domain-containing protein 7B-like isoform X2 [Halichoeres trimaculatus]|uniref:zinc finger CCCH domain-containing protein 7B-like isoform X2 n=1 Tax=Halichoeres trimaculatus TaxID=147232 RepID=UPI003D9E2172